MEIEKIDMNYKQFLSLPEEVRGPVEQTIVKLAKHYFESGDSMSVTIAKVYHESFLKRKIVETTIRQNAELMDMFATRLADTRQKRWA